MALKTLAGLALLAFGSAAHSQGADYYRGGWRTDPAKTAHTYEFVIKGSEVTGVHCTRCADATTLSPLEGTFDPDKGIAFTIRHLNLDGTLDHEDKATAVLKDDGLHVTWAGESTDGGTLQHVAIKDPRGPAPSFQPSSILPPGAKHPPQLQRPAGFAPPPPAPYADPGGWNETLAKDDVVGVWIGFGTGRDKQYFIVRPDDRGGLYGIACGPCDNPYTMGLLENFEVHGDTVEFDINHQDWGEGPHLPFSRHVAAKIGSNELRMDARRTDWAEDRGIGASLVGPIALEATRGNVIDSGGN